MAGKLQISSGHGGKREGAGRKRGGFNRLTKAVIEKAEAAPVHPVDFLLEMLADTKLTMKERGAAAQSLLPYVATRLATTEVNVSGSLSDESEASLLNRLVAAQGQLVQLGLSVIDAEQVSE